MRGAVFALVVMTVAAPAIGAPTCLDRHGDTIRCGVAGAMPVGWTPPPEVLAARAAAPVDGGLTAKQALGLVCALGGLFALIALMPEFDGWGRGGD